MATAAAGQAPAKTGWLKLAELLKVPARVLHDLIKRISPGFEQNFFGSDAFSRSTACYVWLANQFGHLALGVIAAAGPGHAVAYLSGSPPLVPVLVSGLLFLGVYVLKEVADTQIEIEEDPNLPFQLDVFELGDDSKTDTLFVTLGVTGACLWTFFGPAQVPVWPWVAVPFLVGAWLASTCWRAGATVLPCRGRLDASALPGFARLRRFNGKIASKVFGELRGTTSEGKRRTDDEACAEAARDVERFVRDGGGVLVLSARDGASGRTFLAVAVGCELVERNKRVRYLTWRSLKHSTYEMEQDGALPLAEADAVVVDGCTESLSETVRELRRKVAPLPSHLVIVADGGRASDECHGQLQAECKDLEAELGRPVLEVRIVEGLVPRAPNRRRTRRPEADRPAASGYASGAVPSSQMTTVGAAEPLRTLVAER